MIVTIEKAYDYLLIGSSVYLAITMLICFVRVIIGPRLTDRLVALNIISCKVVILFAVLAVYMDELYLLDVCLTYALVSFLAVVVLSKVYLSSYSDHEYEDRLGLKPTLEKSGGLRS